MMLEFEKLFWKDNGIWNDFSIGFKAFEKHGSVMCLLYHSVLHDLIGIN